MAIHDGSELGADQPCFGCGPAHPIGFHLSFEEQGDEVLTRYTPGSHYQGPPGIMHGGLVTTLADELAAWTVLLKAQKFGFTTSLQARLSHAVRIGVPVEGRARLLGSPRRMVDVAVSLHQSERCVYEATFRFALLDRAAAEKLLGGPLPERWAGLAR
jgi:acyl-coenzyme A thioesterase PaaI-like protein